MNSCSKRIAVLRLSHQQFNKGSHEVESYNSGSPNIEDLFEELLQLGRSLSEEQQRHVRENMTEEPPAPFRFFFPSPRQAGT